jgi:hypothetical protein
VHQPTTVIDLIVSMLQLGAALARTADHFDAPTSTSNLDSDSAI